MLVVAPSEQLSLGVGFMQADQSAFSDRASDQPLKGNVALRQHKRKVDLVTTALFATN
jgi:hypothetical protein